MRLWDTFLAADAYSVPGFREQTNPALSQIKYEYVDFVSVALVINLGDRIKEANDFSDIMEMLQNASKDLNIESID